MMLDRSAGCLNATEDLGRGLMLFVHRYLCVHVLLLAYTRPETLGTAQQYTARMPLSGWTPRYMPTDETAAPDSPGEDNNRYVGSDQSTCSVTGAPPPRE